MTIRPVDLQTIIHKLPEVQKAKNVESELLKNNMSINIQKEKQQNEKNTKQVTETKKNQGARIDREGQQKGRNGNKDKERRDGHSEDKDSRIETKGKILTKIDIKI